MKNLTDIAPDIATEAGESFRDEESFRLFLETARKVFTPREQEGLFRELSQRGTPEPAALAFVLRAGHYIEYDGYLHILEHCREATAAPDMVKALGDITTALDTALHLPKLRDVLEKVPFSGGGWVDAEGRPMPFELSRHYSAPDIPPQPMNLPALMDLLREQLHRVEIENRRGPKVREHRRRIVRDMVKQWEKVTGDAPTISDGCGFLYTMGIIWEATARAALSHIEGREKNHGWTLPSGVHMEAMKPGAEDLRNELRAILKEKKS